MSYLRSFVLFWWDFIVGDDWRLAAGVVLALGLCELLVHHGVAAWWVAPRRGRRAACRIAPASDPHERLNLSAARAPGR